MRKALFNLIANISAVFINGFNGFGGLGAKVSGVIAYTLMRIVDPERMKFYEAIMQQSLEGNSLEDQQLELKLLSGASQVRDHAMELGDWTDSHTQALNAIGDALVEDMGWAEDSVHQYMREVVESIDGLEYEQEG